MQEPELVNSVVSLFRDVAQTQLEFLKAEQALELMKASVVLVKQYARVNKTVCWCVLFCD